MTDEDMKALGSRRDFFKKMVALGFAIPVISSFSLEGVAAADEKFTFRYGNASVLTGNGGFRTGNDGEEFRYGNQTHIRFGNGSFFC